MTANRALYYNAELEERLGALEENPSDELMTARLVLLVAIVTLALPILALLIGWVVL